MIISIINNTSSWIILS